MTGTATRDLIASFPAAGAGGSTLEQLEKLAARRGMAYLAMSNPSSVEAFGSGAWRAECFDQLRQAAQESAAQRVVLFGHCMGGLSAICLTGGAAEVFDVPIDLLVVNTPCPDTSGRIPTMSRLSDLEIGAVLASEGFPQELIDDEDMLAEIADGLRGHAEVADVLAESINRTADLDRLNVLSTRDDSFIPPEQCAGWRLRVSREFQLLIVDGGHALDEATAGVLSRFLDSVLARAPEHV